MKIEKRTLSFKQILSYNQGYGLVANKIGSSTFNRKCGQVIGGLGDLVDDYNKRLNTLRDDLKEKYVKDNNLEEFPWYSTPEDLSELSKKERVVVSKWSEEFQKIKDNLFKEECEDVDVLVLSDSDIDDQEKTGKRYGDQGFQTSPIFFILLRDVLID